MYKMLRGESWLQHVAVAVLYCLAISLFRQVSISHWLVLTGLNLSVLMIARYRFWPALMLGEMAAFAYVSYVCLDQLGTAWSLFNLVPTLLLGAPIVFWARERGGLFTSTREVNIGTLLITALIMATVVTLKTMGLVMISKLPPGYPTIDYHTLASRLMLGNYLGILTIAPLAAMVYRVVKSCSWTAMREKLSQSRLGFEVLFGLLPVLGFLVWLGLHASLDSQVRQIVQIAMFLPVVWLALRHGWHGAAIGGTAASVAIFSLMPHIYDGHTIQAEILVAFVISTMLLMGARIASLNQQAVSERTDLRLALSLAQRNTQLGEMQLQMTSQTLEQIGLAVHSVCMMMTSGFRRTHSTEEGQDYRHLALSAKDQLFGLADSLYPVAWKEKGLSSALREGQIPRTLDKAGIKYWCNIRHPLNQLSATLHLAVYRLVCDAIAERCAQKNVSEIGITLKCGSFHGRQWIAIRLSFQTSNSALRSVRWDQILPQVMPASSGRGFESIQDRAATFEGKARERALPGEQRISVLLMNPETATSSIGVH
jgi:glucose-6-phosphate-specific signal transduction histidine kinase